MAAVNAVRSKARDAVFAAGGRGFVRFLPDGEEALLVSDAPRRCQNPSALLCACGAAGFGAEERDGLLLLTPTEETLRSLNLPRAIDVDWSSADAPLAAFAARLMHRGDRPLTENGLRFAVETLRLRACALRTAGFARAGGRLSADSRRQRFFPCRGAAGRTMSKANEWN